MSKHVAKPLPKVGLSFLRRHRGLRRRARCATTDHIRYNGFQASRIVDVRELMTEPFSAFVKTALRKRRERKPRKPKVSIRTLRALLLSTSKRFPLLAIHRENVDTEGCHVGRVDGVANGTVRILEIGPDAVWDEAPSEYSLKQITRIDFGGHYESALHLVGGEPTVRGACRFCSAIRQRDGARLRRRDSLDSTRWQPATTPLPRPIATSSGWRAGSLPRRTRRATSLRMR
jgi:hypothetical protein